MKNSVKIMILALFVLLFCVSCNKCAVCGKNKLITTKKAVLGREFYICKECEEKPANAINGFLNEVKSVTNEISDGIVSVKDNVVSVADEVKGEVETLTNEIKSLFGK